MACQISTADEQYMKLTALRKGSEINMALQLIHLQFTEASLETVNGRVAVKKTLFRRGNGAKRLRYAKLH